MKNNKEKRVRAVFDNLYNLRSEDIEKSDQLKELLKNQVPKAIKLAQESNKIFASIFEINSTGAYLEIHKNHWISALETIILWRVESDLEEDYKTCAEIRDLIIAIKNGVKRKPVIRSIKEKKTRDANT